LNRVGILDHGVAGIRRRDVDDTRHGLGLRGGSPFVFSVCWHSPNNPEHRLLAASLLAIESEEEREDADDEDDV
jgi:hypothetical protein